jgi:hypothetical protein
MKIFQRIDITLIVGLFCKILSNICLFVEFYDYENDDHYAATTFLCLFFLTNFGGNTSIVSKPGMVYPSKKLKQLAFDPTLLVKFGLYFSTALYLPTKPSPGLSERLGITTPPRISSLS